MTNPQNWPISKLESFVQTEAWHGAEATFNEFRRILLASEPEELSSQVDHAELVWSFLAQFCVWRPIHEKQVLECVSVLLESTAWRDAVHDTAWREGLVAKLKALPACVQAAFQAQGDALSRSLSGSAVEKMKVKSDPLELHCEDLHRSNRAYKEADILRNSLLVDSDGAAKRLPLASAGSAAPKTPKAPSVSEQLSEGIEAVLDIDSPSKWENDAVAAFTQLRRGCLHAAGNADAFQVEAFHASAVFSFMIEFARRHKLRVRQASEVLHLLMASKSWAAVFEASCELQERVKKELSDDVQAAFGLQSDAMMEAISPKAQDKAKAVSDSFSLQSEPSGNLSVEQEEVDPPACPAEVAPEVVDARQVAESMRIIQTGLSKRVRHQATIEQVFFNDGGFCEPPEPVIRSSDDWQTATSPEGKTYYWNTRTRETRWAPPPSAPENVLKLASQHGVSIGNRVEVYSYSRSLWCSGVVEDLGVHQVTVSFQLPFSEEYEQARKTLPWGSEDLRLCDPAAREGTTRGAESQSPTTQVHASPTSSTSPPSLAKASANSPSSIAEQIRFALPRASSDGAKSSTGPVHVEGVERQATSPLPAASTKGIALDATIQPASSQSTESSRSQPAASAYPHSRGPHEQVQPDGYPSRTLAPGATAEAPAMPAVNAPMLWRFTTEELEHYAKLYQQAVGTDVAKFLASSGLPRRTLREIWSVGNPEVKPQLGSEEFSRCCRLIGHCQAIVEHASEQQLQFLNEGGRPLRAFLREKCSTVTPQRLVKFG